MTTKNGTSLEDAISIHSDSDDSSTASVSPSQLGHNIPPSSPLFNANRPTETTAPPTTIDWYINRPIPTTWVMDDDIAQTTQWPKYAIWIHESSPGLTSRLELVRPHMKWGLVGLLPFKKNGRYRIIGEHSDIRLQPISDLYLYFLDDLGLMNTCYPEIYELIVNKLHNGEIKSPREGPMPLLRYLAKLEAKLTFTRTLRRHERNPNYDRQKWEQYNWNDIGEHIVDEVLNYYSRVHESHLQQAFPPIHVYGRFVKAFEKTHTVVKEHAIRALRLAVRANQKDASVHNAKLLISRWSRAQDDLTYTPYTQH
jgi:hypothetical protein